jgi:hypothetical protein
VWVYTLQSLKTGMSESVYDGVSLEILTCARGHRPASRRFGEDPEVVVFFPVYGPRLLGAGTQMA